ncbi:MAG TPA: NADPH-dependent F420 reductase [Aquaticitalea sp.]|nr:NADPH-dependent F420 reductase [Aquaticitalea sp.]
MNKSDNKINSYAIIGFGHIGQALAKAFARKGIKVSIATRHEPESLIATAAAIGSSIIPKKLEDAVKADIIFLAVRFESYQEVAKLLPNWQGKILVDMTNAYGVSDAVLGGQPSGKMVEEAFTGGKLVKGFNHLVAAILAQDPMVHGGRRVIFLTSDDDAATREINTLAENLGFAPVNLGRLSEGGMLVHGYGNTWGKLIFKDLVKFD